MSVWNDESRRAAFFAALETLVAEYPEIMASDAENIDDAVTEGFDPSSPKMMSGVVVLVAADNLDSWSELTVLTPARQSQYMTLGMLHRGIDL